jgi:hypothetical protein
VPLDVVNDLNARHRVDVSVKRSPPFDQRQRNAPVLGVIRLLPAPLLPTKLAGSLNDFARRVAQHPEITIHSTKAWGDLLESARSAIKREVQSVAQSVGRGKGKFA